MNTMEETILNEADLIDTESTSAAVAKAVAIALGSIRVKIQPVTDAVNKALREAETGVEISIRLLSGQTGQHPNYVVTVEKDWSFGRKERQKDFQLGLTRAIIDHAIEHPEILSSSSAPAGLPPAPDPQA